MSSFPYIFSIIIKFSQMSKQKTYLAEINLTRSRGWDAYHMISAGTNDCEYKNRHIVEILTAKRLISKSYE